MIVTLTLTVWSLIRVLLLLQQCIPDVRNLFEVFPIPVISPKSCGNRRLVVRLLARYWQYLVTPFGRYWQYLTTPFGRYCQYLEVLAKVLAVPYNPFRKVLAKGTGKGTGSSS